MTEKAFTVRTRKFMANPLMSRKQFVVDVLHPGRANVSKAELTEKVAKMYSAEANTVFLYGFRTAFGGGKSTGFGLVYDSPEAAKKLVPKYLQIRAGIADRVTKSRKQTKERKNRAMKVRGVKKTKMTDKKKSDEEDVVVVRRNRRHLAALRVDSDGEGERPEVVIPATLPVDATQLSEEQLEGGDAPLDTAPAAAEPQPRLVRLKRRGDVAEQQEGGGEDADDEVEDGVEAEEMEEEEVEEDEEAAMERRVAEKGTLSDGEGSEEEGGDAAGQEEQGALDAAVLERLQLLRQARKDKEAQELEQQHILKESASRVKFKGSDTAVQRTDMNSVLDRIRARAGAVLPAAPPDESMLVAAQPGRGGGDHSGRPGVPIPLPSDLGDLDALVGGHAAVPGNAAEHGGEGDAAAGDELIVLAPEARGRQPEDEEDDEEDGTGGMRLFGRPPGALQLRMDDTQAEVADDEEDPMAGEAAAAAAMEEALVSETESDEDEEAEEGGDDDALDGDGGEDAAMDGANEDGPPPQEALLTEEERAEQRAAVRAAAMELLAEEKAARAAERAKAKARAVAAAAAAAAGMQPGAGGDLKLGFMEDEAEMSEDGGHTDDDEASDTDDDLAELEAMLAAAEEDGDAAAADAIRAKIHADWEQAADDRAVAGVVRAMQNGWRRRRGRRLRGEDGDLDDDDPRGPRRRRRGAGQGDDEDDDGDVRNPFLMRGDGDGEAEDDPQVGLRGAAPGSLRLPPGQHGANLMAMILQEDDPSRAVLGLLRRQGGLAPSIAVQSGGTAMEEAPSVRGGFFAGSLTSAGGEGGASLPARRGMDAVPSVNNHFGSSRAFVFGRQGEDSQSGVPIATAGDMATPAVGVRGAKAAARAALAAATNQAHNRVPRSKGGAGGGTSLLGLLRSGSQTESQASIADVGENLALIRKSFRQA